MNREAVQDFLNLPGIVGVALIDGRSRPYFYGIDQFLNFQQKEALAQGIRQVIATTPSEFDAFEFQFIEHQIYIYKLDQGLIFLVMADSQLSSADYTQAIKTLKLTLKEDLSNAIATFRLLAGSVSLPSKQYWNSKSTAALESDKSPVSLSKVSGASINGSGLVNPANFTRNSTGINPKDLASSPENSSNQLLEEVQDNVRSINPDSTFVTSTDTVTLKDCVEALNQLSQFAKQYLGTAVIVNYWRSSRPDVEWLKILEVERSGKIYLPEPKHSILQETLSLQQQQWLQQWVAAFLKRCSVVIRDFPRLVKQDALDETQKRFLLP